MIRDFWEDAVINAQVEHDERHWGCADELIDVEQILSPVDRMQRHGPALPDLTVEETG